MESSPIKIGAGQDASLVGLRLPGSHTSESGAPQPSRIETPAPPRINYDPSKLRENLQQAIDHLNQQLAASGRTLSFAMDDALNYPVVTVRSMKTGEIIRQIPSEAVVRVAHTIEGLKGLLHNATS